MVAFEEMFEEETATGTAKVIVPEVAGTFNIEH